MITPASDLSSSTSSMATEGENTLTHRHFTFNRRIQLDSSDQAEDEDDVDRLETQSTASSSSSTDASSSSTFGGEMRRYYAAIIDRPAIAKFVYVMLGVLGISGFAFYYSLKPK